jgi:hypothetical protein
MQSFVQGLVIQKNRELYMDAQTGCIGQMQPIPCPGNGGFPQDTYWAVPVTDSYQFTGFRFTKAETAPTPQSFEVVRVTNSNNADVLWVLGTAADYVASCSVCCDNAPIPMPTDLPLFAPCQPICVIVDGGEPQAMFALPTISPAGGLTYYPVGYLNEKALPEAAAGGYSSTTALMAFLNAAAPNGWGAAGVWSLSADDITLTLIKSGGTGSDVICAAIYPFSTSTSGVIE